MSDGARGRKDTPAAAVLLWLVLANRAAGVPLPLAGAFALSTLVLAFLWRGTGTARLAVEGIRPDHPEVAGSRAAKGCHLGRGGPLTAELSFALHSAPEPAQGLCRGPARRARAARVQVALSRLQRNVLALGSPGSGKSSLLVLLAWQAQRRGEAVVVIDPKGSRALRAHLAEGARLAGRPFLALDAAGDVPATRYDPLLHCADGGACADRLCGLVGDGRHDPFREFCWGAVAAVCEALIAGGEHPSLARLHQLLPDAGQALLPPAGPSSLPPPGTAFRVAGGSRLERALDVLQALAGHDRTHYRKMTAPLLPLLALLAGGRRGALLSAPGTCDSAVSLDLWRSRTQGATVLASLDALGQPKFTTALAWLLLDDLARLAAQGWRASVAWPPLQVMVDEAGEVACEPLLRLLGKGREAGVNVVLATQTMADLDWCLGGPAAAHVALGNAAAWFLFRQLDARSRLEAEARLGNVPVPRQQVSRTRGQASGRGLARRSSSVSEGREMQPQPRVPAAAFAALRELECVAHLPDGEVLHLRLPRPLPPGA